MADAPVVTPHATSSETVSAHALPADGSEYLLVCEASALCLEQGTWRFTLEQADGTPVFSADDTDIGDLNRLTLLAAVRGLESIDGPSSVTLLSNNRYLIRSLSDSLPRWRQNNFVWEHFGRRLEVQHADLWRRINHALLIHRVEAVLVSSRLVSPGILGSRIKGPSVSRPISDQLTPIVNDDEIHRRFDPAQPSLRKPNRGRSSKQNDALQSQDRLRQWLIGNATDTSAPTARKRLTASELMQTT